MAREARLWQWMHERSKQFPDLHLQRIENTLAKGTPDVEGCYASRDFWIELKGANRPVRNSTPVRFDLTVPQVLWLERRWSVGGLAWLYMRVGRDRAIRRYVLAPEPGVMREVQAGATERRLAELSLLAPEHSFRELLSRVANRLDLPCP